MTALRQRGTLDLFVFFFSIAGSFDHLSLSLLNPWSLQQIVFRDVLAFSKPTTEIINQLIIKCHQPPLSCSVNGELSGEQLQLWPIYRLHYKIVNDQISSMLYKEITHPASIK